MVSQAVARVFCVKMGCGGLGVMPETDGLLCDGAEVMTPIPVVIGMPPGNRGGGSLGSCIPREKRLGSLGSLGD